MDHVNFQDMLLGVLLWFSLVPELIFNVKIDIGPSSVPNTTHKDCHWSVTIACHMTHDLTVFDTVKALYATVTSDDQQRRLN